MSVRAEARQVVMEAVRVSSAASDDSAAIDAIIQPMDELIGNLDRLFGLLGYEIPDRPDEAFLGVSDALAEINPSELTVRQSIALLGSCANLQDRLPGYALFYERARAHLAETRPDEVNELLEGYDPRG